MAEEPGEAKSEYLQSTALDHNDLHRHGNRVCLALSLDWDNNLINRQSSDLTTNIHVAMALFGCHGYSNSLVRLKAYRTVTYKKTCKTWTCCRSTQWNCFQVIDCTDSVCGHHSSLPVFVLCSAQTLVCPPSYVFLNCVQSHLCHTFLVSDPPVMFFTLPAVEIHFVLQFCSSFLFCFGDFLVYVPTWGGHQCSYKNPLVLAKACCFFTSAFTSGSDCSICTRETAKNSGLMKGRLCHRKKRKQESCSTVEQSLRCSTALYMGIM